MPIFSSSVQRRELCASFVIAILAFLPAFFRMGHLFTQDWHYFNDLSWIVRSEVFHYARLPLHEPWFCGGLDIIQNPQNRVLSPLGLLDLALPPQWANLTSLLVYAFFGALGMIVLLREEFSISFLTRVTTSALFLGSSWFGLHFSEGHIPFGALQILPWVYLLGRRLARGERVWPSVFALAAIFTLMVLDGGIYALVFSLMLLATLPFPRAALARLLSSRLSIALIGLAALCLSLAKMYPVLQALRHRGAGAELTLMTPKLVLTALFYPWQSLDLPMGITPAFEWRFHEFGCYIGWIAPVVLLWAWIKNPKPFTRQWRLWIPALFFFWIGTGFLDRFNPWNMFRHIPVFNNVHVQSRIFLLFFLFFLLLLAQALERLRGRSKGAYVAVLALLIAEFGLVHAHTLAHLGVDGGKPPGAAEFIDSTTISSTVGYGYGPSHLRASNRGTQDCYEPSFMGPKVEKTGAPDYRGEAYLASGTGTVSLLEYTPGKIEAGYSTQTPATVAFNTRILAGWSALLPAGAAVHPAPGSGLLGVDVPAGSGEIILEYTPHYLRLTLALYLLGWVLWGWAWRALPKEKGAGGNPPAPDNDPSQLTH